MMHITLGNGILENFNRRHGSNPDEFATLEDFGDRLNRFYTTMVMLILAGVTMANVYFLRPISCYTPQSPSPGFGTYVESVCWVQGTIALDHKDPEIPSDADGWRQLGYKGDISFYQWVPFSLSIQAILFYLPYLLWQAAVSNSLGDNFGSLISRAKLATAADDPEHRRRLVHTCADQLDLLSRQHYDNCQSPFARFQHSLINHLPIGHLLCFGKRLRNRTVGFYLLTKIAYIGNCLGQLFLIMRFLEPDHSRQSDFNAVSFSKRLFSFWSNRGAEGKGREWGGSEMFPLQALCPVSTPNLGTREQVYTAICALPINMLNAKIYMFLWVWISMTLGVSVFSCLLWISRLLIKSNAVAFLRRFLEISLLAESSTIYTKNRSEDGTESDSTPPFKLSEQQTIAFFKEVVGIDGTFLIRMIRINAGDIVTGEILVAWWRKFQAYDSLSKGESRQDIV